MGCLHSPTRATSKGRRVQYAPNPTRHFLKKNPNAKVPGSARCGVAMSQTQSLDRALFRRSANILVFKLRFARTNPRIDTGHVYVLGLESCSEQLSGRLNFWDLEPVRLILPENT